MPWYTGQMRPDDVDLYVEALFEQLQDEQAEADIAEGRTRVLDENLFAELRQRAHALIAAKARERRANRDPFLHYGAVEDNYLERLRSKLEALMLATKRIRLGGGLER